MKVTKEMKKSPYYSGKKEPTLSQLLRDADRKKQIQKELEESEECHLFI